MILLSYSSSSLWIYVFVHRMLNRAGPAPRSNTLQAACPRALPVLFGRRADLHIVQGVYSTGRTSVRRGSGQRGMEGKKAHQSVGKRGGCSGVAAWKRGSVEAWKRGVEAYFSKSDSSIQTIICTSLADHNMLPTSHLHRYTVLPSKGELASKRACEALLRALGNSAWKSPVTTLFPPPTAIPAAAQADADSIRQVLAAAGAADDGDGEIGVPLPDFLQSASRLFLLLLCK